MSKKLFPNQKLKIKIVDAEYMAELIRGKEGIIQGFDRTSSHPFTVLFEEPVPIPSKEFPNCCTYGKLATVKRHHFNIIRK